MMEIVSKALQAAFKIVHTYKDNFDSAPLKALYEQYLREKSDEGAILDALSRHVVIYLPYIKTKDVNFFRETEMPTIKRLKIPEFLDVVSDIDLEQLCQVLLQLCTVVQTASILPPALLGGVHEMASRWESKMQGGGADGKGLDPNMLQGMMSDVMKMVSTHMPSADEGQEGEDEGHEHMMKMMDSLLQPQHRSQESVGVPQGAREFRKKLC